MRSPQTNARRAVSPGLLAARYGQWAIVTGASDGIGREFARELAREGMSLVLVARRGNVLEELAVELRGRHSVQCQVIELDLSDPETATQLDHSTAALDVGLVVAAAGFGTSGPLAEASLEAEINMVSVNCSSVLAMAWCFGRRFSARGRGGIVLMSSMLGFHGVPFAANYAATKAYVQSLAEGLRSELRPQGVDVIASAPGPIHSGFSVRANMIMSMSQGPEVVARGTLRALGRQTTVRPGWLSKSLGWTLAMNPRWLRIQIIARIMKGMTSHQKRKLPFATASNAR
jgi:short-subunit dehydrogenase